MEPQRKKFSLGPRARLGQARNWDTDILGAAVAQNEVSETEDLHAELNYVRFETAVSVAAARVVSKRLSNKSGIWKIRFLNCARRF